MQISLKKSTEPLNQTAAILLAAAVVELFPDVQLVNGQGGEDRFYFDFVFPFEFQENFLPLIEERMRFIIREKRNLKALEMVPSNAAALMRHQRQEIAAENLSRIDRALVSMCRIGEFTIYSALPFQDNFNSFFFKILEGFQLDLPGRPRIRIVGSASMEKERLKVISKKTSHSSICNLNLAKEMALLEPLDENGTWLWRPRGMVLCTQLIDWWREEHLKQNFSLVATPTSLLENGELSLREVHREYFLRNAEPKVAEVNWISSLEPNDPGLGLFCTPTFFADRAHLFCTEEKLLQECISSLHFILKIPKILGFEFEIVLSISSIGAQKTRSKEISLFQRALEKANIDYTVEREPQMGMLTSICVRLSDSLGRKWTGPFLGIPEERMPAGKGYLLTRSAFGSMERMTALLLEKTGGWLPLWLAPEQVRVLVVNHTANGYANEVLQALRDRGIRVRIEDSEEKLKTQLYRAILEKVPYVILLGEREKKAGSLTVRNNAKTEEQSFTLEEFCGRLKVEIGSGNSELTN